MERKAYERNRSIIADPIPSGILHPAASAPLSRHGAAAVQTAPRQRRIEFPAFLNGAGHARRGLATHSDGDADSKRHGMEL